MTYELLKGELEGPDDLRLSALLPFVGVFGTINDA
jgi:hypothetical protein